MDTAVPALLHRTQFQGIADTIVQLIRWSAEGVISSARATRSEERRLEGGLSPCGRLALVRMLKMSSLYNQIFPEGMAKTCRMRPGDLTRNTDS